MRFALRVALRFLSHSKSQSIVIVLGIAVGVSVQVFIGALIIGLQQGLIDRTIGNSPHITVRASSETSGIRDWEQVLKQVRGASPSIAAVTATADAPGFAIVGKQAKPILFRGLDLATADAIYGLRKSVYSGSSALTRRRVLVGRELADKLHLSPGDAMSIGTASGRAQSVQVAGLYDLKVASLNASWVIGTVAGAQSIFGLGNSVTAVEAQVSDVFSADKVADSVSQALGAGGGAKQPFAVEDWKAQNQQLLAGLKGQSISSAMIQVCVLVAVLLGISSILAMTVMQKSRQIGILKAMGLRDGTASYIFLIQGLVLGLAGTALGLMLALGLGWSFTKFAVNPDGTAVAQLAMSPGFIGLSVAASVLCSAVASVIPARKSLRLSPIEVIRNG